MDPRDPSIKEGPSGTKARRLAIVTSRLPVTPKTDKEKTPLVEPLSAYGYTSTLLGIAGELDFAEIVWIGWPGVCVTDKAEEEKCTETLSASTSGIRYVPVWLSKDEVDKFFDGFCNSSLWPLLHWMTPYAQFKAEWAETYWQVNERFAEAVQRETDERDIVWVHDYHFFMLPQFLRDPQTTSGSELGSHGPDLGRDNSRNSMGAPASSSNVSAGTAPNTNLQIVFFLHTPFPSYEVLSVHPQCNMLLEGVLGANLIGFHTYMYLRHFRSSIFRKLGCSTELDRIDYNGMRTKLAVCPIGPNVKSMEEVMKKDAFEGHLRDYIAQYEGKNVVLSVDRLDYAKGFPQKMAAIGRYLEMAQQQNQGTRLQSDVRFAEQLESTLQEKKKAKGSRRELLIRMGASMMKAFKHNAQAAVDHTKTVFVLIAAPSRQRDQAMEEQVQQTVSQINGRFSTPTHQPIVYIYSEVSPCELAALYARADCCLVTPLIDGMNLIAKEFLVAKDRHRAKVVPGLVVLSMLTGAAQELFDALVVNPHDENAVAQAITFALELDISDRWRFTENMRSTVLQNNARQWAEGMLSKLQGPVLGRDDLCPLSSHMDQEDLPEQADLLFGQRQAGVKALFLDFAGTLEEEKQDGVAPTMCAETRELCEQLNERASNDGDLIVYIMSWHERAVLQEMFRDFQNLTLVAEDGSYLQRPGRKSRHWETYCPSLVGKWKDLVKPVMVLFAQNTPGARVDDQKKTTIAWCYAECDTVYGEFKAHELAHLLSASLVNLPCQVTLDSCGKTVEVASLQANKGIVVQAAFDEWEAARDGDPFSAVFCAGNDSADEAAFQAALSLGEKRPEMALITAKVGTGKSHARYRVSDPSELRKYLSSILRDDSSASSPLASKARTRTSFSSATGTPREEYASPAVDPNYL
mmetsp:Transcript_51550/g.120675  ORF Transcript_51550/g.120675 Transcript_51550/m.120675 type:complete len:917 (+) Transcript_51550:83-2833(+)